MSEILKYIKASMATRAAEMAVQNGEDETVTTDTDPIGVDNDNRFYASINANRTMIKDKTRINAYRKAIDFCRHEIRGKVVMDVGCGLGILSLFVAQAGAKRVIAVEPSDLADCAKQVMIDNDVAHVVTVLQTKVEDIKELPDGIQKVDVIISEFMGYSLLYESRMDTVIIARDKWLVPGGIILPDQCTINIFGVSDPFLKEDCVSWWDDPDREPMAEGFSFETMRELALKRPWTRRISKDKVVTEVGKLIELDLNTIQLKDLELQKCKFDIQLSKKNTTVTEVNGLGTCFEIKFSRCFKPVGFSTSPFSPPTSLEQTVFFFSEDISMLETTSLYGVFAYRKSPENLHDYNFSIWTMYNGENQEFNENNRYQYLGF